MHRRTFLAGSLGVAGLVPFGLRICKASTPVASSTDLDDYPILSIGLTDTGFEIGEVLAADRYHVVVSNNGTSAASHFALGRLPDGLTDAQFDDWINSDGDTDALSFEDIAFVGVPDWAQPGGSVSGVIDLAPGRYFLFDPFDARGYTTLTVEGELNVEVDPPSDVTVLLGEMTIALPEAAFTTRPMRWRIENHGAISHEVAVVPVSPDFTEADLHLLFSLPEDATPPAGVPDLVYQPAAAIGILAGQHTSWLDVQLAPGRYMAACMLPFGTGYPHAMDGMYLFFEVQ
jgi:hypothetical protein